MGKLIRSNVYNPIVQQVHERGILDKQPLRAHILELIEFASRLDRNRHRMWKSFRVEDSGSEKVVARPVQKSKSDSGGSAAHMIDGWMELYCSKTGD